MTEPVVLPHRPHHARRFWTAFFLQGLSALNDGSKPDGRGVRPTHAILGESESGLVTCPDSSPPVHTTTPAQAPVSDVRNVPATGQA